jgi:hypothetical protein
MHCIFQKQQKVSNFSDWCDTYKNKTILACPLSNADLFVSIFLVIFLFFYLNNRMVNTGKWYMYTTLTHFQISYKNKNKTGAKAAGTHMVIDMLHNSDRSTFYNSLLKKD